MPARSEANCRSDQHLQRQGWRLPSTEMMGKASGTTGNGQPPSMSLSSWTYGASQRLTSARRYLGQQYTFRQCFALIDYGRAISNLRGDSHPNHYNMSLGFQCNQTEITSHHIETAVNQNTPATRAICQEYRHAFVRLLPSASSASFLGQIRLQGI